jgi:hypothetical protein
MSYGGTVLFPDHHAGKKDICCSYIKDEISGSQGGEYEDDNLVERAPCSIVEDGGHIPERFQVLTLPCSNSCLP